MKIVEKIKTQIVIQLPANQVRIPLEPVSGQLPAARQVQRRELQPVRRSERLARVPSAPASVLPSVQSRAASPDMVQQKVLIQPTNQPKAVTSIIPLSIATKTKSAPSNQFGSTTTINRLTSRSAPAGLAWAKHMSFPPRALT